MVDNQKTQQMIAFFIDKADRPLSQAHLMSFLYLADRQAIKNHRACISGDSFVATPSRPVLFKTMLKMIDGGGQEGWGDLLYENSHDVMSLRHPIHRKNLFLINEREHRSLLSVWQEHHALDEHDLAEYVRCSCSEWSTSRANNDRGNNISYKALFSAFGWIDKDRFKHVTADQVSDTPDTPEPTMPNRAVFSSA